jgi:hypothetical protein
VELRGTERHEGNHVLSQNCARALTAVVASVLLLSCGNGRSVGPVTTVTGSTVAANPSVPTSTPNLPTTTSSIPAVAQTSVDPVVATSPATPGPTGLEFLRLSQITPPANVSTVSGGFHKFDLPDGRYVGTECSANLDDPSCEKPFLFDPKSGEKITIPLASTDPIDRIESAVVDGDWIAMVTHPIVHSYTIGDYKVQTLNLKTLERHEIFRTPGDASGKVGAGPRIDLKFNHGTIAWFGVSAREPIGKYYDTYVADIVSGKIVVLEPDSLWPDISWPYVFVNKIQPDQTWTVVRVDLRTGDRKTLPQLSKSGSVAATAGFIATMRRSDRHLLLSDIDGNVYLDLSAEMLPEPDGYFREGPTKPAGVGYLLSGDGFFLSQRNNDVAYLIDPVKGYLVELGSRESSINIQTRGTRAFWWASPDPKQVPSADNIETLSVDFRELNLTSGAPLPASTKG